jgi:hypothetical protein
MAMHYRVVDLRPQDTPEIDIIIEGARSPEDAVRRALGLEVVRSGSRRDLVARVYWQMVGQPLNMVRLYTRTAQRQQA